MTTTEHIRDLYRQVNGDHPMSPADVEYCLRWFVPLPDEPDYPEPRVLDLIAAGFLPVPSYLLPDGRLLVHPDYLAPIRAAGGHARVREWFTGQWPPTERSTAQDEWRAYLTGQYVCLYSVSPSTIQAKTRLIETIRGLTDRLDVDGLDADGRDTLAAVVHELDELEPAFTAYDRLRFGGPVSRDVWIDDVRRDYLSPAAV